MSSPATNAFSTPMNGRRDDVTPNRVGQRPQQDEGVEQLFANICRLRDGNNKLIEHINSKAEEIVQLSRYSAPPMVEDHGRVCTFKVKEERVTEAVGSLVRQWKWKVELIEMFDMFNLKVDYKCETYADLCRLNKEMFDAATRYNMFYDDDSKKGRVELAKFIKNFTTVGEYLQEIKKLTVDAENKEAQIQAVLTEANALLKQAYWLGLRFSPPHPLRDHLSYLDGLSDVHYKALYGWMPSQLQGKAWVLRYQATHDGFGADQFHTRCDGKQHLVSLIQTDKGYIFGGYSATAFSGSSSYGHDSTAFIFTLVNPHGVGPSQMRCTNHGNSIHTRTDYHVTYGSGHDIHICNNPNTSNGSYIGFPSSYQDSIGRGSALFTGSRDGWRVAEILCFTVAA